jgi:profilin
MNQLQNLLHDALIATNHIDRAALLNKEDYSVKASSVGFQIGEPDVEVLVDAFQNTQLTRERGIYFDDVNYTCVRSDEDSIYAKSAEKGLVMVQTAKWVLVATYKENMYPSVCVEAVERLGKKEGDKELVLLRFIVVFLLGDYFNQKNT